jgi:hypothetical protein
MHVNKLSRLRFDGPYRSPLVDAPTAGTKIAPTTTAPQTGPIPEMNFGFMVPHLDACSGGRGTAMAISDNSQQPYCPPGTRWGPGTTPIETPGSRGYRVRYYRWRLRCSSLYRFSDKHRFIRAFIGLKSRKRAGVQVSEPDTPVLSRGPGAGRVRAPSHRSERHGERSPTRETEGTPITFRGL